MCQFTIPYAGHTVTLEVGLTCGRGNVHDAWESNQNWGADHPRLKGIPGAVYDPASPSMDAAAVRFASRAHVPMMAWWDLYDSRWYPSPATMTSVLEREVRNAKMLSC